MGKFFNALFGGSKQEKDEKRLRPIVESVNREKDWAASLKDEDFPRLTEEWKKDVSNGKSLDELLPKAFAAVREASRRVLGEFHYDVQIMGAAVLCKGSILEMKTGEGKTLTSVPAAYLNALEGKGVHIVTVNDYLAQRDAEWMGPIYRFMGMTVGVIYNGQDEESKRIAYSADITYGTNNEFGFDYLRDNMKQSLDHKVQPRHHYAIVDEIDSILIDEARTPLIISGQAEDDTPKVMAARAVVPFLKECEKDPESGNYYELSDLDKLSKKSVDAFDAKGDFKLDEKNKSVSFTAEGMTHIESCLANMKALMPSQNEEGETVYDLYDPQNFDLVHYVTQAVKAQYLFKRDVDYLVRDGEVQIVDEFTGRVLVGRRYSEGLHQAIEAKENVRVQGQSKTFATITFQNFFRMYDKLSGMTGTAATESVEFMQIYNLDVVVIPTNKPIARKDLDDLTYFDEASKYNAIVKKVKEIHATHRPILIGTTSIEKSEKLSALLRREGIKHEVLNAKNHAREAFIIGEAGAKDAVTIATNMAGRGTDIKLGGSPDHLALKKVGTDATPEELLRAKQEIMPEYRKAYEEVKSLGGLYIIGSERHESRRIDNQLRGRAGRQGDPGTSVFYVCFDDPLMRLFAKEGMREMIGKHLLKDGEEIHHKMLSNAIEGAQKKVEERNFEIRKRLLEYDDVLNDERNIIYQQRDEILADKNLAKRVIENTNDIIDELDDENKDPKKFIEAFRAVFATTPADELVSNKQELKKQMEENIRAKEAIVGAEIFNDKVLRPYYLYNIDKSWVDHLDVLTDIKDAAMLQTYAQKNPLIEYKKNAVDAFEQMLENIMKSVCRFANIVRITTNPVEQRNGVFNRKLSTNNPDGNSTPSSSTARKQSVVASSANSSNTTIRRATPKIGRNDPCPCGSGKKYKNCCGKHL